VPSLVSSLLHNFCVVLDFLDKSFVELSVRLCPAAIRAPLCSLSLSYIYSVIGYWLVPLAISPIWFQSLSGNRRIPIIEYWLVPPAIVLPGSSLYSVMDVSLCPVLINIRAFMGDGLR